MPTPRLARQVALQVRLQQTVNAQGAWIPGIVTSVVGVINSQYQVALETNETVTASSLIDLPLAEFFTFTVHPTRTLPV